MKPGESIKNESNANYFSMIPHCIDDFPLSAAEVRLYLHYKRRAGELPTGKCWESTENIARHLRISKSTVTKSRRRLEQYGLIRTEKIPGVHGEFAHCEVYVRDVWLWNNEVYGSWTGEQRERFFITGITPELDRTLNESTNACS